MIVKQQFSTDIYPMGVGIQKDFMASSMKPCVLADQMCIRDRVEAITGADYIVTTLRVGGDHSRVVDETIALDLGVIGQETTGVGGFSMAVRTIPVLIEYCELIKKYAPDAWIFNFTNPSGLVTQALRSAGYDKIIGICDAPSSTKFRMARDLGVEEDLSLIHISSVSRSPSSLNR